MRLTKKYWVRANCIIGYPFMLFLDAMIVLTDDQKWVDQRMLSERALNGIWHKYD